MDISSGPLASAKKIILLPLTYHSWWDKEKERKQSPFHLIFGGSLRYNKKEI